jgi:uncharacterized protein
MNRLKPSSFLRIVEGKHSVALYHALEGNLQFAELPVLRFFELLNNGESIEDLQFHFPDIDIPTQVQRLRELHFLTTDEEDAWTLSNNQRMNIQFEEGQLVSVLRLNISTACNLNCAYCYGNPQKEVVSTQTMPFRIAKRAIASYIELMRQHGKKKLTIRFFGGEPFLNWSVMLSSIEYAQALAEHHNMQLRILINSNATLLSQEIVDKLFEFEKYLRIIISLDGRASEHNLMRRTQNNQDSFELVITGLKRVQKKGLNFTPNIVVSQHNIDKLRDIIDFFVEIKIYQTGLNPVLITDKSEQKILIEKMLDAIDYARQQGVSIDSLWMRPIHKLDGNSSGVYCSGSGSELSIAPDGSIYPCQTQPFLLGTMNDLESRALFKTAIYRHITFRSAGNIPECQGCEIEGLCAGGCAGDAYAIHKSIYMPTQHCEFMRAITKVHIGKLMQDFDKYRESRISTVYESIAREVD